MTDLKTGTTPRQGAMVAGISLIVMAVAAGFAVGFVFERLLVPENAAATAANIQASETLFRAGLFSWLLILVCDVLAAWGLYVFLKPANSGLSLLTAWLRLVYTAILGISLSNLVIVLLLLSGADYLTVFDANQVNALLLLFINAFEGIWTMGLVVFGLHLLALGYLVLKSGYVPKILGVLLLIAALGYLLIDGGTSLLPNFEAYRGTLEVIFIVPMIVGELGLAIWLLVKGARISDGEIAGAVGHAE